MSKGLGIAGELDDGLLKNYLFDENEEEVIHKSGARGSDSEVSVDSDKVYLRDRSGARSSSGRQKQNISGTERLVQSLVFEKIQSPESQAQTGDSLERDPSKLEIWRRLRDFKQRELGISDELVRQKFDQVEKIWRLFQESTPETEKSNSRMHHEINMITINLKLVKKFNQQAERLYEVASLIKRLFDEANPSLKKRLPEQQTAS